MSPVLMACLQFLHITPCKLTPCTHCLYLTPCSRLYHFHCQQFSLSTIVKFSWAGIDYWSEVILEKSVITRKYNFFAKCYVISKEFYGCLESVEWNGGMEHWNGILEWPKLYLKLP